MTPVARTRAHDSPEATDIMSAASGVPPCARTSIHSRESLTRCASFAPSSGEIERCDSPTRDDATRASFARHTRSRIAQATSTTARVVLVARQIFSWTARARVVAARSEATRRATASFVENFALAGKRVSDGIKHGTVRNETTPRVRAVSILPTQSTGGQALSSRVTPSRHVVLSPMFLRTRLTRCDRTLVGCRSSEDQGGPS